MDGFIAVLLRKKGTPGGKRVARRAAMMEYFFHPAPT